MSACRSACHRKSCVSDVSARILARMSMSVSVSASWNSSLISLYVSIVIARRIVRRVARPRPARVGVLTRSVRPRSSINDNFPVLIRSSVSAQNWTRREMLREKKLGGILQFNKKSRAFASLSSDVRDCATHAAASRVAWYMANTSFVETERTNERVSE